MTHTIQRQKGTHFQWKMSGTDLTIVYRIKKCKISMNLASALLISIRKRVLLIHFTHKIILLELQESFSLSVAWKASIYTVIFYRRSSEHEPLLRIRFLLPLLK